MGAAAIGAFIASQLDLPNIAYLLAPIIAGVIDIVPANFCATDPPSDPGLTAGDIASAIEFPPSLTTFTAQQKIVQWFEHQYWHTICQCDVGTTPAPATPSNPGPISTNPGLPTQSTACWNVTVPYDVPPHGSSESGYRDFTTLGQPAGQIHFTTITFPGGPLRIINASSMPAGARQLALSATVNEPIVSSLGHVIVASNPFNSLGNPGPPGNLIVAYDSGGPLSTNVYTVASLDSTEAFRALTVGNDDTVEHTGTLTFSFFCAPGTAPGTPCCPPDPLLEGELQQILQYVQAIYAGIPIPPSSFAEGAVHSGLSGAGSITFSSVPIALKVVLTTLPPWVGFDVGDPDFYFDVGFVSFGTSEGNYASERITYSDQVLTVPVLAGSLGYSFKNGVVASITELLPGP